MSNRPVGRITLKSKDDKGAKHIGIAAVWEGKFPGSYNVSFGDRELDTEEVLDMIASEEYWINFFWNEEDDRG